jgi:hypothetical protein
MIGEEIRLSRLFGQGNAVVVAVDHGLYNGPLPVLIDLPRAVASITEADAILTSPGMVAHCKSVLRTALPRPGRAPELGYPVRHAVGIRRRAECAGDLCSRCLALARYRPGGPLLEDRRRGYRRP